MTQYLMHKKKDFKHLQYALDNYEALLFLVSPFSLGNETRTVREDLEGKTLKFVKDKGIRFFTDKELIHLPLKNYRYGFKLEYQRGNNSRIYPYYENPNDPELPMPAQSTFRHVIDDFLIEIFFKGKILLEKDKNYSGDIQYWTLRKK